MPTDDDKRAPPDLAAQLEHIRRELARLAESVQQLSSTSRHDSATIGPMSTAEIVAPTRKRRGPPSEGPVVDLQIELGFASMQDLADALQENPANLRSWNARESIPARVEPKIAKLRAKKQRKP